MCREWAENTLVQYPLPQGPASGGRAQQHTEAVSRVVTRRERVSVERRWPEVMSELRYAVPCENLFEGERGSHTKGMGLRTKSWDEDSLVRLWDIESAWLGQHELGTADKGYVRWSVGFWGHAREEEGILPDNVCVPHGREAKHPKFYTTDSQARFWSPAHWKLSSIMQQAITCWLILGSSTLHTHWNIAFNPCSCVPGCWSLPILLCISIISILLDNQQFEGKKSDYFSPQTFFNTVFLIIFIIGLHSVNTYKFIYSEIISK